MANFNDSHPFNDSMDNTMYTAALDAILTFQGMRNADGKESGADFDSQMGSI